MDQAKFREFLDVTTSCGHELYMKTYAGIATFFRSRLCTDWNQIDIALVGLPIDAGLTQRTGARHGPREIRNQSCNVLYYNPLTQIIPFELARVADIGDVPISSAFSLDRVIGEIHDWYRKLHQAGVVPITAGGDHSITFPILKAIGADRPVGLIHIDSHLDCAEQIADSTLHHGSPFWNAVNAGVLDPKRTVHIAIRDPYSQLEPFAHESGMTIIDIDQFYDLGVKGVIAETRRVIGDGPAYITFDVDGLDPAYAPGTGTPVVGGITTYEAKRLLQGLRGLDIVGGDVVEVSPPFDSAGITALAGAQLMFEILCLAAESVEPETKGGAIMNLLGDLDRGLSLPASWYTDPAILGREQEGIFRRSWQYIGRAEQLIQVGDFLTGAAGDVPIVVVRGEQGLKAFVNVCRHRRHEVMSGTGNRKVLQCPYHAWTYDLDGCLQAAPRTEREANFNKEDWPLLPARVDTWGPWVFVNLDAQARPLADYLGELPRILSRSGVDLGQLTFHTREVWERDANWKVMIENYLECYHCAVQHPGFSAVIDVDPDTYTLESSEWFSSQTGPVKRSALEGQGKKTAYDARGAVTQAQYHFLWPNFTININPGHMNLSIDVWQPDGPTLTRGISEYYFGPDAPLEWKAELIAFSKQVGSEDDQLTDSVQRGLRGGLPMQGRFLMNSEHLVMHFQKLVLTALTD